MFKKVLLFCLFVSLLGTIQVHAERIEVERADSAEAGNETALDPSITEKASQDGSVRVIVGLKLSSVFQPEGAIPAEDAVAQRAEITRVQEELLDKLTAADAYVRYTSIPYIALEVNEEDLELLAESELITTIQEDVAVPHTLASSTSVIGMPSVWNAGHDGSGQTVVILDTGIDAGHSFFGSRVVDEACFSDGGGGGVSLCPNGNNTQTGSGAADATIANCNGGPLCDHGTHVAGIAAGNGTSYDGVARGADIIAIQVFTRFTNSTPLTCASVGQSNPCVLSYTSDQLSALQYVFNTLAGSHDIASVNMSLGGGSAQTTACDTDSRKAAIDNLVSIDVATVIASGNNGWTNGVSTPGCISSAITVGSTTDSDLISSFSNMGSLVDLLAPGSDIDSSVPGGGFAPKQGTSMAAPHVAGAWAVLKAIDPSATVSDIETALETNGVNVTDGRTGGTHTKPRIAVDQSLPTSGKTGTLYYDWYCDGSYGSVAQTYYDDGTLQSGPYSGHWSDIEGAFIWQYDTGNQTTYVGNTSGKTMSGIMSTFSGLEGCWYLLADDNTGITITSFGEETGDVLGNGVESNGTAGQPEATTIPGTWTLHYDWNCDGSYFSTSFTFNNNGTFSGGKWYEDEGMIHWKWNNYRTSYGGNVIGDAMAGVMSTFSGLKGCWYAVPSGTLNLESLEDDAYNVLGEPVDGRSADDNSGIIAPMANVTGSWTLYYDWRCDGSYSSTPFTINNNGTFSTGFGNAGKWTQLEGKILWQYNNSSTTYQGNVAGDMMLGLSGTFSGLEGCWYTLRSGSRQLDLLENDGYTDDGVATSAEVEAPEGDVTPAAAIPGTWTLYYDWYCDGSYSSTTITFNNNGTFNYGDWIGSDGMILWKYGSPTAYGGNVAGEAMTGISSTFSGLQGCWYALQSGSLMVDNADGLAPNGDIAE